MLTATAAALLIKLVLSSAISVGIWAWYNQA